MSVAISDLCLKDRLRMTYRTMYNGRCYRFSIEYTNVIHHRSICFIQPRCFKCHSRLHQGPLTLPCFRRLLDTTPATPKKTNKSTPTLQSLCRLLLLHLGKQVDLLVDSYLCGRLDFKIQHFKSTTLPGIFRFFDAFSPIEVKMFDFDAFFHDWSQNIEHYLENIAQAKY